MTITKTVRRVRHDLRCILMQWLLLQALRVAPWGGSKGDLAANVEGFFDRDCQRLKEARN